MTESQKPEDLQEMIRKEAAEIIARMRAEEKREAARHPTPSPSAENTQAALTVLILLVTAAIVVGSVLYILDRQETQHIRRFQRQVDSLFGP